MELYTENNLKSEIAIIITSSGKRETNIPPTEDQFP